jgi:hypothetical protein
MIPSRPFCFMTAGSTTPVLRVELDLDIEDTVCLWRILLETTQIAHICSQDCLR